MRSDVKIGLVCGLVLLVMVVVYVAFMRGEPKVPVAADFSNSPTPALTTDTHHEAAGLTNTASAASPTSPTTGPTYTATPPGGGPLRVDNASQTGAVTYTPPSPSSSPSTTNPAGPIEPLQPSPFNTTPSNATGVTRTDTGTPAGNTARPTGMAGNPTPGLTTTGNTGIGNNLPAGSPELPAAGTYVVQKGDNFWKIAKAKHVREKAIEQANPGIDSSKLHVGMKINLPEGTSTDSNTASSGGTGTDTGTVAAGSDNVPAPDSTVTATTKPAKHHTDATTYTVKKGDTLMKIAAKVYGDKKQWRRIARANGLDDPADLEVGATIKIPAK